MFMLVGVVAMLVGAYCLGGIPAVVLVLGYVLLNLEYEVVEK